MNSITAEIDSSLKTICLENPSRAEDWTVVLPRRGKKGRRIKKATIPEQVTEEQSWSPVDIETDPEREVKLMQKMQICTQKFENSQFACDFLDQMQSPEMLDHFSKVLDSEANMKMVIYGIGSIESFEPPRLQLSLAILMKRKFDWIGEIEVFDPIISLTEYKVLTSLGCSVLRLNEQGRRQAFKPTLFFMPHCEAELYNNLLQVNWVRDQLNHIALFGNSFAAYEEHVSLCNNPVIVNSRRHILAIRRFVKEFGISTFSDDTFRAFHGSSWHFFSLDSEEDLNPDNFDRIQC